MALINGGEAQFIIGDFKGAVSALKKALVHAERNRYNDLALKSSNLLYQCFAELDDKASETYYRSIHNNYQDFFISKDSLARSLESLVMSKDSLTQKKAEIIKIEIAKLKEIQKLDSLNLIEKNFLEAENQQDKLYLLSGIGVVLIFLIISIVAYQYKRKTNKKLEQQNKQILKQKTLLEKRQQQLKEEKAKTDSLLLNILPAPVAEEIRRNKKVVPRYYKKVTIMFTDFKGFTSIASRMSPGEIVRELDVCFMAFDQIIENYEKSVGRKCVEKIKTIGDGYMCAGGVPIENDSNPMDVVRVGLAIRDFIEKRKVEKELKKEPFFEIRIGINTGPVVAGVVGKQKFAYDIWGDAVNIASRMETSCEVGRVNISGDTYKYIRNNFFFTHRGRIQAKNKGEVDMYFVDGRIKYAKPKQSQEAIS